MIKNTLKINNPLTVIAVFSMLTEASAAVSLPYIDSEHQKIYVWFLIVFPLLLIVLFFLTLNFNNKTLYTPADFSKAENTHTATHCSAMPCMEPATRIENTETPVQNPFPPVQLSGIKYNLYSPQNFILLPQEQRIYDCAPLPFPVTEKASETPVTKSQVLIEAIELQRIHLIDLSHPPLRPSAKSTPEDVLHSYYKATRKYKNQTHKHDVLLLLTHKHSNIPPEALRLAIEKFKYASAIAHTTIISYNINAHRLAILNSP